MRIARFFGPLGFVLVSVATRAALAAPSTTTIEQGYQLGEVPHPRSLAMVGAQQAFGGSTVAIFLNPANLTLFRVYHLEGLAAFGPEARRQTYGGAVADSSTSRLAGGLAGTWSIMDPDGIRRTWTDVRLALAYPLTDRVTVGLTGRYLRVGQSIASGPLGASLASDGTAGQPLFNEFTFDAGIGLQLTDQIRFAASGRNLTAPGTGLAPLGVAGGIGWSNQTFTVEADTLWDFTTYGSARGRAMIGAELMLADKFPIRAGYRYDDGMKTQTVGLGVGYVDRKFSLELGGNRDVAGEHPATLISIGLRVFIDSGATPDPSEAF